MFEIGRLYPLNNTPDDDGVLAASVKVLGELTRLAMARLAMEYRMTLALRLYENMSYAEIARILGCSELGARMRFFNAKRTLARELKRLGLNRCYFMPALRAFEFITLAPAAQTAT